MIIPQPGTFFPITILPEKDTMPVTSPRSSVRVFRWGKAVTNIFVLHEIDQQILSRLCLGRSSAVSS